MGMSPSGGGSQGLITSFLIVIVILKTEMRVSITITRRIRSTKMRPGYAPVDPIVRLFFLPIRFTGTPCLIPLTLDPAL